MPRPINRAARGTWIALRLMLIFTVLLGIAYPLLVTGIGQLAFPWQANGSPVRAADGRVVGSAQLGQSFSDADGKPLRQYFQPRPSAAGKGYDAAQSGGSNLGPESPELVQQIGERKAQVAEFNGVPESRVPVDAVTASGSGLDPNISPAYARLQVRRVAEARGMPQAEVERLVDRHTSGPDLGFIGETRVNVVELNLALDEAAKP
ncbi:MULTISPECIES: potassium-transporting ATPase subunit KdpC [unclassified Leucobacter]|uniref:potassium-transporting ATPase subunit KdpC n=1 Tax=unclassified Leucobacter TaxID=2621730 RepID=UPI0006221DD5|nr:potassium-transporting ATPase subunit KdpC [Leucobacter sp. Ag1]KKI21422.1 potassium transporter KtrA [Leucobacter sp. Ag1]